MFEKTARSPRVRKIGWWIAGITVFVAVAGFLVAPPLVKHKLEEELSAQLHRKTTVERIHINPFALTVIVQGFVIRERGSDEPALSFDELRANVSSMSLFRLAPVVTELRLVKPRLHVVRSNDKTYNFQDPYLRAVLGFLGVTDQAYIHVNGTSSGTETDALLAPARDQIKTLAAA